MLSSPTFSKRVLQVCATSDKLWIVTDGTGVASVDEPLHNTDTKLEGSNTTTTKIKFSIASLPKDAAVEVIRREEAIGRADHGINAMQTAPLVTDNMEIMLDGSAIAADAITSFADTWDLLLDKIKLFVDIVDDLGKVLSLVAHI